MSRTQSFWDLLNEISGEIPRFSTDFITPDGINYRKMIETIKGTNFNDLLPMWTLGSDLAMMLLKNASPKSKMVEFVEAARNCLALYSLLDDIHTNIVPSNAMENRNEIAFWKSIGNKFNANIPICDYYSTKDSGQIPLSDILMFLISRLKDKEVLSSDSDNCKITVEKIGMAGTPPLMTSAGTIISSDTNVTLLRIKALSLDEKETLIDMYYTISMEKIDTKDLKGKKMILDDDDDDDEGSERISGGKLLIEHGAYIIGNPEDVSTARYRAVEIALMLIYSRLDSSKFHFFIDYGKLSIHNNSELLSGDEESWVRSPILDQIGSECARISDSNMTHSYAFVGPPGTGKTTTCEHLMLEMAANGFTLIRCSLSDRYLHGVLSRIQLALLMSPKAVILFDDLDSLDIRCKTTEVQELIDFLDKVQRGTIPTVVFSTVNNPKNIHSTVIGRSGRIDEVIVVDYPNSDMISELLRRYSKANGYQLSEDAIGKAADKLAKQQVSVADIKNLTKMMLIKHGAKDTYTAEELDVGIEALVSSRAAISVNYCRDDQ